MKLKTIIREFTAVVAALASLSATAENWVRFSPEGEYAILCSTNDRFLANTLYLGGEDMSYVRLVDEFDAVACTWVVNDEGDANISVRNTQGGLNDGDYIRFDSKIRLASTVNFTDYLMNQTFQFYHDEDAEVENGTLAVKVRSQGNQVGWWKSRPAGDELGYETVHTLETATLFYLIPADNVVMPNSSQTSLALTGSVTAEQLYEIRDEMFKLRDLDLSGTTLKALPPRAFSGMASLQRVVLPEGLEEIGDAAFLSCEKLAEVALPASLKRIGALAFERTALTSVEIGLSVSEIGCGAWSGCKQLAQISVDEGNEAYCSVEGVLYDKAQTLLILCPAKRQGAIALPETLVRVEDYACEGCTGLTGELILPSTLKYIGDFAFADCKGFIGELSLPAGLIHVGRAAFYGANGLIGCVTVPSVMSQAGSYGSFAFMEGIEHIELPATTVAVPASAFEGCASVVRLRSAAAEPPAVGAFAFRGINRGSTYVEVENADAYRNADTWSEFENYSSMPRQYERFDIDGDYYIATADNYYLSFNSADYGAKALLAEAEGASLWELVFTYVSDPAVPFGAGKATDISYIKGESIFHINMEGKCWEDPLAGYGRNPNRTFAIWFDSEVGLWAIQSNGYVWLYDGADFVVKPYRERQPLAEHFVWRLTGETSEIEEIESLKDNSARCGIYDLSGRKLQKAAASGIYIINGVKTLVK